MKRWKLVDTSLVLASNWLNVERNTYSTANGVVSDYYVVSRSDFVLVIAMDREDILLVRQYRPATDEFYLALPAGYIDPGEAPLAAAQRELEEETGLQGTGWNFIGKLDPLPGYVRSKAHIFQCETRSNDQDLSVFKGDSTEGAELVRLGRQHILDMISRNEIMEMQAVAAILLSELNRSKSVRLPSDEL